MQCATGKRQGMRLFTPIYSCHAIIKGITLQLEKDGHLQTGEVGLIDAAYREVEEVMALQGNPNEKATGEYKDDMSGQVLADSLVHDARALE